MCSGISSPPFRSPKSSPDLFFLVANIKNPIIIINEKISIIVTRYITRFITIQKLVPCGYAGLTFSIKTCDDFCQHCLPWRWGISCRRFVNCRVSGLGMFLPIIASNYSCEKEIPSKPDISYRYHLPSYVKYRNDT